MKCVYKDTNILFKVLPCLFIAMFLIMCLYGSNVYATSQTVGGFDVNYANQSITCPVVEIPDGYSNYFIACQYQDNQGPSFYIYFLKDDFSTDALYYSSNTGIISSVNTTVKYGYVRFSSVSNGYSFNIRDASVSKGSALPFSDIFSDYNLNYNEVPTKTVFSTFVLVDRDGSIIIPLVNNSERGTESDSSTDSGENGNENNNTTTDTGNSTDSDSDNGFFDSIAKGFEAIANFFKEIIEFLNSLFEGLIGLFVPSEESINSLIDSVTSKFAFITTIKNYINSLQTYVDDVSSVPTITIHLGKTKYTAEQDFNINFSWYAPYKSAVDSIITAFIYLMFLWRLFIHLPNIVNGVGGSIDGGFMVSDIYNDIKHKGE